MYGSNKPFPRIKGINFNFPIMENDLENWQAIAYNNGDDPYITY